MRNQLNTWTSRLLSRARKLRKDDNGAAAVAMGVLAPVLIGGMALGAETGYWYYTQRKLQHAADVAAHAAGVRKRVGDSTRMKVAAVQVATASGFVPVKDSSTTYSNVVNLTVNNPPLSGALVGKAKAVEVSLYETHPRMLSAIFTDDPVQIGARAVAEVTGGSPACVLALSETKPRAVEVSGNSSATLHDCSVASNSAQSDAYYMPNSTAFLSADCVSTVGESVVKNPSPDLLDLNVCSSVQEQAPKALDPYADVAQPNLATLCAPSNTSSAKSITGAYTPPYDDPLYGKVACFSNGLELDNVQLGAGLYIILNGSTLTAQGTVGGDGVTFYFQEGATAQIASNPTITLTAPTSGPLSGLLFFSERCDSDPTTCNETFKITGTSTSSLQGAIYLPGSEIEFLGTSGANNNCLQIIADRVTFTGKSELEMGTQCGAAGTREVLVGQVVKLVE